MCETNTLAPYGNARRGRLTCSKDTSVYVKGSCDISKKNGGNVLDDKVLYRCHAINYPMVADIKKFFKD